MACGQGEELGFYSRELLKGLLQTLWGHRMKPGR